MIGRIPRRIEIFGQVGQRAADVVDRDEVQRGAAAGFHVFHPPFGDQLEGGIDRIEMPDRTGRAVAGDDGGARDDPVEPAFPHQPLRRSLARLVAVGKAAFRQRVAFRHTPVPVAADIGRADVEQRHPAKPRQGDCVGRAPAIGPVVIFVRQVEARGRRDVDEHVVRSGQPPGQRFVQPQQRLCDIARDGIGDCDRGAIVRQHLAVAMDQRRHRVPARHQPRRRLPAQQACRARHQDFHETGWPFAANMVVGTQDSASCGC